MKIRIYHILALILPTLAACTESYDGPKAPAWPEGKVPLAMRPVSPAKSRATFAGLDGMEYDVYLAAPYYTGTQLAKNFYYNRQLTAIFSAMEYDTKYKMLYVPELYFPPVGEMELYPYGVEAGHEIDATMFPPELDYFVYADSMGLDLTHDYDGTFDIIAADMMPIHCQMSIDPDSLPYGHFHHIMAHLDVRVRWANDVAASSDMINRFFINSIKIDKTTYKGLFCFDHDVKDGRWNNKGADLIFQHPSTSDKRLPYGHTLDFISTYIIPGQRQKFIINYTMLNGDDTEITMNYVVADDLTQSWLAGHKYTYTIVIGDQASIDINNVVVKPFEKGNVGTTEIN